MATFSGEQKLFRNVNKISKWMLYFWPSVHNACYYYCNLLVYLKTCIARNGSWEGWPKAWRAKNWDRRQRAEVRLLGRGQRVPSHLWGGFGECTFLDMKTLKMDVVGINFVSFTAQNCIQKITTEVGGHWLHHCCCLCLVRLTTTQTTMHWSKCLVMLKTSTSTTTIQTQMMLLDLIQLQNMTSEEHIIKDRMAKRRICHWPWQKILTMKYKVLQNATYISILLHNKNT